MEPTHTSIPTIATPTACTTATAAPATAATGGAAGIDPGRFRKYRTSPVAWGEAFLANRDGSPRRYRSYQKDDLLCAARSVVHVDGRAVGKTIDVSTLVLWFAHVHKGKSVLVVAPFQGQLDTIIEEVEYQLANAEILRNAVARTADGDRKIKRTPYFQFVLDNGSTVYFRPGGTRGDSFRSLHVDLVVADEAAWLTEKAWEALGQCLNAGGIFRVYSTPNGLRGTTFYHLTHDKNWTHFHWPSWISPDWSEERRKELLSFYGGSATAGWLHEVAGEHGMPTYGAFNASEVLRAVTEIPHYRKTELRGEFFEDCTSERAVRDRLESLVMLDAGPGRYWLGADLGYTSDPTEVLLFQEEDDEQLTLVLRVHAERVPYPTISELIALIDRVYAPLGLGIDRGGNGVSVEQELTGLDKYRDCYFAGRLVGYDFGGSIVVGEDGNLNPIRKRTKEEMTLRINKALHARKLSLPKEDPDVEDQLCTQTYTTTDRGVVYSKGNDHIVDAMRCALLRRAQTTEPVFTPSVITVSFIPLLTDPIFD